MMPDGDLEPHVAFPPNLLCVALVQKWVGDRLCAAYNLYSSLMYLVGQESPNFEWCLFAIASVISLRFIFGFSLVLCSCLFQLNS